jgi:putative ABC transport system permease protein
MAIPIIYNIRSVKARWTSTIVAVLGIAGTVGVFVAMLSLARGFQATLVASGSKDNALIVRAGATSEMTSGVTLDSVKIIQDAPGIARGTDGPLVTPESVLMAPIPLLSTGTDANVELRGVSPNVLEIRKQVKIVQGRMFKSGLAEVVVGKNANTTYSGLTLGKTIKLGSVAWQVVGVFGGRASSHGRLQSARKFFPVRHRSPHFSGRLESTEGLCHQRPSPQCGCHPRNRLLRQAIDEPYHAYHSSRWFRRFCHGYRRGLRCA